MARIGIDFGTCNSSAALLMADGELKLVPAPGAPGTGDDRYQFPTVAYLNEDGSILTCHAARNTAQNDPGRFIHEFKLRIAPGALPGHRGVTYERLVAAILDEIKTAAENILRGETLEETVITVPADCVKGDEYWSVMHGAAFAAGLPNIKILYEPVAAGQYFEHRLKEKAGADGDLTLVYDLGGGTFDPALMRKTRSGWKLASETLEGLRCAGAHIDQKIEEHFKAAMKAAKFEYSPVDDVKRRRRELRIRRFCTDTKHTLGRMDTGNYTHLDPVLDEWTYQITRDEFNKLIDPILEDTLRCCERQLQLANLKWSDLAQVFMVGGSCNIRRVEQKLRERLNAAGATKTRVLWSTVNGIEISPDYAVCKGAALGASVAATTTTTATTPPTTTSLKDQLHSALRSWQPDAPASSAPKPKPEPEPAAPQRSLREQMLAHPHFAGHANERSSLLEAIKTSLKDGDLTRADMLTIKLLRIETGFEVFNSQAAANTIPGDLLRQLHRIWYDHSPTTLRERDWIQYERDCSVTTKKPGFFSITTWLEQRFIDLGI